MVKVSCSRGEIQINFHHSFSKQQLKSLNSGSNFPNSSSTREVKFHQFTTSLSPSITNLPLPLIFDLKYFLFSYEKNLSEVFRYKIFMYQNFFFLLNFLNYWFLNQWFWSSFYIVVQLRNITKKTGFLNLKEKEVSKSKKNFDERSKKLNLQTHSKIRTKSAK